MKGIGQGFGEDFQVELGLNGGVDKYYRPGFELDEMGEGGGRCVGVQGCV